MKWPLLTIPGAAFLTLLLNKLEQAIQNPAQHFAAVIPKAFQIKIDQAIAAAYT
jgi:hypothetical protein